MEVAEAYALVVQPVKVWRLEDRITVTGEVAVALVVGQQKDDVRSAFFEACRRLGPGAATEGCDQDKTE
jgi:hypothetical protein